MRNDDTDRLLEARLRVLAAFGDKLAREGKAFDAPGESGDPLHAHAALLQRQAPDYFF